MMRTGLQMQIKLIRRPPDAVRGGRLL